MFSLARTLLTAGYEYRLGTTDPGTACLHVLHAGSQQVSLLSHTPTVSTVEDVVVVAVVVVVVVLLLLFAH